MKRLIATPLGRRSVLALLGAASGALGGFGLSIVLTQGGRAGVDAAYVFPGVGVLVGATLGFLDLGKRSRRVVTAALIVAFLLVGGVGMAPPVSAQSSCTATLSHGDRSVDLLGTSRSSPHRIDLDGTGELLVEAAAADVAEGTVEVSALSAQPFWIGIEPGGLVLYYDRIDGGTASSAVRVQESGTTGFTIEGTGYESPILPLGVIELGIVVADTSDGGEQVVCDETAWIRLVARPISNRTGQIGLALAALGLVGLAGTQLLSGAWRPPVAPEAVTPAPPMEQPPSPRIKEAAPGPFIEPGVHPHSPGVKTRILSASGEPIPFGNGLSVGGDYRLELTLSPGLSVDQDAERTGKAAVSGWSRGVEIEPVFGFELAGMPISLELPMRPRKSGRRTIAIDLTANGQLLHTEHIEVSVAAAADDPVAPQSARAVFAGSDLSTSDLAARTARTLLVILERDADGSVDARIRDEAGRLVAAFDSPLQPEALSNAAIALREALHGILEAGPGKQYRIPREQLAASLVPLVKTGRQLHRALFRTTRLPDDAAAKISDLVADGAIIQIAQQRSGLGHSTLPWNLVYDHPFTPIAGRNLLCPDFPDHEVDECPNRDDSTVFCPTGFWGYRAIVEEPHLDAAHGVLPSPLARNHAGVAIGYLDPGLADTARQAPQLGQLGIAMVAGFAELLESFSTEAERLSMLYFYAHHSFDAVTGAKGIVVGRDLLSGLTFDEADDGRWTNRPLVFVNGCSSGDYSVADPLSLVAEFRAAGACGVITTECTVWDPLAGRVGERIIEEIVAGRPIGAVLHRLRRTLLADDNNLLGFAYRLEAPGDTQVLLRDDDPDLTIDVHASAPSRGRDR